MGLVLCVRIGNVAEIIVGLIGTNRRKPVGIGELIKSIEQAVQTILQLISHILDELNGTAVVCLYLCRRHHARFLVEYKIAVAESALEADLRQKGVKARQAHIGIEVRIDLVVNIAVIAFLSS